VTFKLTRKVEEISDFRTKMYDYLLQNKFSMADILVLATGLMGQVADQYLKEGHDREAFVGIMEHMMKEFIRVYREG